MTPRRERRAREPGTHDIGVLDEQRAAAHGDLRDQPVRRVEQEAALERAQPDAAAHPPPPTIGNQYGGGVRLAPLDHLVGEHLGGLGHPEEFRAPVEQGGNGRAHGVHACRGGRGLESLCRGEARVLGTRVTGTAPAAGRPGVRAGRSGAGDGAGAAADGEGTGEAGGAGRNPDRACGRAPAGAPGVDTAGDTGADARVDAGGGGAGAGRGCLEGTGPGGPAGAWGSTTGRKRSPSSSPRGCVAGAARRAAEPASRGDPCGPEPEGRGGVVVSQRARPGRRTPPGVPAVAAPPGSADRVQPSPFVGRPPGPDPSLRAAGAVAGVWGVEGTGAPDVPARSRVVNRRPGAPAGRGRVRRQAGSHPEGRPVATRPAAPAGRRE